MVYVIQDLLTACEQDQDGTEFHPEPARSEKHLMTDRWTVRNTYFYSKNKFEKLVQLVSFVVRK